MSDLSKTDHGHELSFVVLNLVDDDTAHISSDFLRHHVSSSKKQRKKIKYTLKQKNGLFISTISL